MTANPPRSTNDPVTSKTAGLLDPLEPPKRDRVGFWRRVKWLIDPHYCIGIRHDGSSCRRRVFTHGERCWDCWEDLVRAGDINKKILLTGAPDLPLPVLQRLATDNIPAVRTNTAAHAESLSPELQVFLAGDTENESAFRAIAERHDLCEAAVTVLLETHDLITYGSLLDNPATPAWALEEIASDDDDALAAAARDRLAARKSEERSSAAAADFDDAEDFLDGLLDDLPGDADPTETDPAEQGRNVDKPEDADSEDGQDDGEGVSLPDTPSAPPPDDSKGDSADPEEADEDEDEVPEGETASDKPHDASTEPPSGRNGTAPPSGSGDLVARKSGASKQAS